MVKPVIPSYIIDSSHKKYEDVGVPLYVPDLSEEYARWLERQNSKNIDQQPSTVIVIDI